MNQAGTLEGTPTKGRWTRLAALGLVMIAIGPLLMLIGGAIFGLSIGDEIAFFAGTALIALVGAFVISRFNTLWARIVAIVAAVLSAGPIFWTVFGLFAPGSFLDFVPGLLVLPGAIIALTGAIASIVARKRADAPAPADGERRALKIIPAVVGALALVSGVLTFIGQTSADESKADTKITYDDFEFDKASYSVAGGSTVYVKNDDPFLHTFTIEELDIDVVLSPGSEKLVEIPAEPGEYIAFCEPHTSDPEEPADHDMAAEFTVD